MSITIVGDTERETAAFKLSPESWCEQVAMVSPLGLTGATLVAAKRLHGLPI